MDLILYGIPNCDQVKKACAWLDQHGVTYRFHDFKKSGIDRELVDLWLRDISWDVLLNRKGTTWRALSEERRATIVDAATATELMIEAPSLVKRPVLFINGRTQVGFSDVLYEQFFKN